jgi:lysophospholipase L1-like esterase
MSISSLDRTITFAVLGDSAASGVGDADKNGICRGWAYYLARAFSNPVIYVNVARPGAKTEEVRDIQLNQILPFRPTITAVIVGGNDLLRNGFDPKKIRENLSLITRTLTEAKSEVLLMQLHDASQIVPMPYLIRRVIQRRANALNEVTEEIAREFDVIFVKVRDIQNVYQRKFWHVDRMHPSTQGHQVLAQEFARRLHERRWTIEPIPLTSAIARSRLHSAKWMLRNGTPWFLKRSVDLLPAMIFLSLVEVIRIIEQTFRAVIYRTHLTGKIEGCNRPTRATLEQLSLQMELTSPSGPRPLTQWNSVFSTRSMDIWSRRVLH